MQYTITSFKVMEKKTESQKLSFASHHIQTRISFVNQRNISGEEKAF